MRTLLVAGASGALGSTVARLAAAEGWSVRAMARDEAKLPASLRPHLAGVVVADARDRAAVDRAVAGVDAVFSCVGASVLPALGRGWRGFGAVDWPANRTLVDAARAVGAPRFVYVSVFHQPDLRRLAYVDAHERVVDHLRASGLPFGVVRPTGFYSALSVFVDLARKGKIPEFARGTARTNPIADDDLARVCVDALGSQASVLEVDCGGPETLTRHEIAETAFAALGKPARTRNLPAGLVSLMMTLARPFHPRITQFAKFIAAISTRDLIAPAYGQRRLADAFRLAAGSPPA